MIHCAPVLGHSESAYLQITTSNKTTNFSDSLCPLFPYSVSICRSMICIVSVRANDIEPYLKISYKLLNYSISDKLTESPNTITQPHINTFGKIVYCKAMSLFEITFKNIFSFIILSLHEENLNTYICSVWLKELLYEEFFLDK